MTAAGFCASAVSCDGTRADDLEAAVAHVVDGHGALHVLVNSAGITQDNLDHKLADDEWHGVIATNLTGSFFLARAAQRPMVRQRRGRSRSSAQPLLPAIAADQLLGCQGGTVGMTRTLALDWGHSASTSNRLSPGHIDTPKTREQAARLGVAYERIREDRIAANSIKRVGEPEDTPNVASLLVSEKSRHLTGQTTTVTSRPIVN